MTKLSANDGTLPEAKRLLVWVLPWVVVVFGRDWPVSLPWIAPISSLAMQLTLFFATRYLLLVRGVRVVDLLGKTPSMAEVAQALPLVLLLIVASLAGLWLVYWPLSFLVPGLVLAIVFEDSMVASVHGVVALAPTLVRFVTAVLVAPIVEEIVFRGVLFARWAYDRGSFRAMLFSSVIFGVLHVNPIGGTVFGLVMCIVYLRTRSLLIPIALHATNNLAALGLDVWMQFAVGWAASRWLEWFQQNWSVGVLSLLASALWFWRFARTELRLTGVRAGSPNPLPLSG